MNLFFIVVGMLLLVSISQVAFAAPPTLKATGGGWINAVVTTPPEPVVTFVQGDKKTFGFNAMMTPSGPEGELQYVDHDFGLVLHSLSVDNLYMTVTGYTFSGTCRVNGVGVYTYVVYVEDNGEPGVWVDIFSITIYGLADFPGGYYVINTLSGGNIQIHS